MKGDGFSPLRRVQVVNTPTGPLAIYRTIAERLLKEGVISGTLDGELHAADALTVKAATMAEGVCDFCSAPGVTAGFDTLDFDMPLGLGKSVDGWAACGPCAELIKAEKHVALLNRSIDAMAFSKFTRPAIEQLHTRFWKGLQGMGVATGIAGAVSDFVNDKVAEAMPEELTERMERIRGVSQITGLTVAEVVEVLSDDALQPTLAEKLLNWGKRFGTTHNRQRLVDLINTATAARKPLTIIVPHWQRAMDAQGEVMRTLRELLAEPPNEEYFPQPTDLDDPVAVKKLMTRVQARQTFRSLGFEQDMRLLRNAEVYSFNAETEAAIIEASSSIPHSAPLSSLDTPNAGAGWFWFDEPIPVAASPAASDKTQALLWSWVNTVPKANSLPTDSVVRVTPDGTERLASTQPALVFSAYVMDEKGLIEKGKVYPSTRWYWPLSLSFHDMLAFNAHSWRKSYGVGSPMEGDPYIIGEKDTLMVIASLSLFFAQACVWFRQTLPGSMKKLNPVLTTTPGHIERHARKRHVKEFKLDEPPKVHVVALRKTARVEVPEDEKTKTLGGRDYHCRWVVKGHPRMQPCGPGRKDKKLIFIESYTAGPADKPLRTKRTVYAVVR